MDTITLCPLCTKFPSIRTALKTSSAGHLLLLTSRGKTIRSRHRGWQQFKQSQVRFIFCWNWIKYKCQTKWCMWKQPPFVKCYILCLPNSAYQRVKFQRPLCTRTKIYISAFPNAEHSTVLKHIALPYLSATDQYRNLNDNTEKLPVLPLGLLWGGSLSPDKNCRLKMKSYILLPDLSLHLLAVLLQP